MVMRRVILAIMAIGMGGVSVAHSAPGQDGDDKTLFARVHERYQAVEAGVSFYYYTQADRIQIVQEFFRSLELDYALLPIKAKQIGWNLEDRKAAALAAESAYVDVTESFDQATSNLRFLDRMRMIGASLQDSHFALMPRSTLNGVLLPFTIAKAEGKYFISARFTKLLAFLALSDDTFGKIGLGQEVVSIDGKSIEQLKQELLPYIDGSTLAAREETALFYLTFRSFNLPSRPFAVVELRGEDGKTTKLKFPWMYRKPSRGDQNLYFQKIGFRRYDDLRMVWNEKDNKWKVTGVAVDNEEPSAQLPKLKDESVYVGEEGDTILKTGYFVKGGRAYAVVQIRSFSEIEMKDPEGQTVPVYGVLREFVAGLEREGIPLVLDLRNNPGGRTNQASMLLSVLTPAGVTYSGPTDALRMNRYTVSLVDSYTNHETAPEELKTISEEDLLRILTEAGESGALFTDAYSHGDITTDEEVGGYSQKIIALVGPDCVSTCDIAATLLKTSGRATLLGRPTNGTGAGFTSTSALDTNWSDSYKVLRTRFPNFLFGRPGGAPGEFLFKGQAENLNLEGRPATPDVVYESTRKDILKDKNLSWMNKAIELIEAK